MKVAVLGTGNMGAGLARRIARSQHSLTLRGRDPTKAADLARSVGASTSDQPANADVVIVATPYAEAINALQQVGDLTGKVIIDITNPLTPDYSGLTVGFTTSAAEEIQKVLPKAKVVKAFNTVFAQLLAQTAEPVAVYFAGDDAGAREIARQLIADIGFRPVDAGPLKNARLLEPLAVLNIYFGYGAGHGTSIFPAWHGL